MTESTNKVDEQVIDDAVQRLSENFGYDSVRTKEIMNRMAEIGWFSYMVPAVPFEGMLFFFNQSEALDILDTEDLEQLLKRTNALSELTYPWVPFYTFDELANLTDKFIKYLKSNQQHLIKTGFPRHSFDPSVWFNQLVSKLYYVKIPLVSPFLKLQPPPQTIHYNEWVVESAESNPIATSGPFKFTAEKIGYYWETGLPQISKDPFGHYWEQAKAMTSKGHPVTLCSYEEAAYIPGFSQKEINDLEQLRPKIYRIKINILEHLREAIIRQKKTDFWSECYQEIRKILTDKEVSDLLLFDLRYAKIFHDENDMCLDCPPRTLHSSGGLWNLIDIIMHFGEEIKIGIMNETKRRILDLPVEELKCYFQAIRQPWRNALDAVLDDYETLAARTSDFYDYFIKDVGNSLKIDYQKEIISRFIATQQAKDEENHRYSNWIMQMSNSGSELIGVQSTSRQQPQPFLQEKTQSLDEPKFDIEPTFRKEGGTWKIIFNGIDKSIKHYIGTSYIACLLEKPYTKIHPKDLWTKFHPECESQISPEERRAIMLGSRQNDPNDMVVSEKDDRSDRLSIVTEGSVTHDHKSYDRTKQDLHERLSEAIIERDEAEEDGLRSEGERLDGVIAQIKKEINSLFDKFGKPRELTEFTENRRRSVTNEIRRCIRRINEVHAELATHLNKSIHYSPHPHYSPKEPTNWIL